MMCREKLTVEEAASQERIAELIYKGLRWRAIGRGARAAAFVALAALILWRYGGCR